MSTLKVDSITGYSGGDVSVTGSISTAVNLTPGDKVLSGTLDQQFTAPGTNQEKAFANVTGAVVNGKNYNRVFYGMGDYPGSGIGYEDYFAIEYYDSFGYNFGTEFNLNGYGALLTTVPSGSGFAGQVAISTKDNYDGTGNINLTGGTGATISLNAPSIKVSPLGNYADDTAAAAGGVEVNGLYRSGSQVMIRVS